jgi:hypothetical protein
LVVVVGLTASFGTSLRVPSTQSTTAQPNAAENVKSDNNNNNNNNNNGDDDDGDGDPADNDNNFGAPDTAANDDNGSRFAYKLSNYRCRVCFVNLLSVARPASSIGVVSIDRCDQYGMVVWCSR